MSDDTRSTLDHAREYARNGVYVYPVYVTRDADGKKTVKPAVASWSRDSSASLADVEAWWGSMGSHPSAGIGIDCGKSHLVGVDLDTWDAQVLWRSWNPAEPIGIVKTLKGEHWYYREDPDHLIGNDQDGTVGEGIDIRGVGGTLFAPGTPGYSWEAPPDWGRNVIVPQVVIEKMTAKKAVKPLSAVQVENNLFDDAEKRFTKGQAEQFVKEAMAKLGATDRGFNGAINNFAMACAHFPWLVDRDRCARLMIKAIKDKTGWTAPDQSDLGTINSAYTATEGGRSWVAVEVTEDTLATATEGVVLPPPTRPLDVAHALVAGLPQPLTWWRGDFYRHTGAHWEVQDAHEIEGWLYQVTRSAVYHVPAKKDGEPPEAKPWAPTRSKVGDLTHALGVGEVQRKGEEDRVLAAANGVVVNRELLEHDPARFNLFSLPFDYEPSAECPAWQEFLEQVLPGDQQAKDFLGEWFGYVLSGRTNQQKMAALIGQKRSGKGTIARVLGALIGKDNVSGLNLGALAGTFGLEPFIGAALAVASDVRWHSKAIGDAIQPLLEVSGEDHVTVHRKNQTAWKGRLGVRFMLMSNDTPTFSDRSGALVDRMIYVSFRQSFLGREDTSLTDKLMGELPGILNWALDGLERLDGRGRFTQPESGQGEQDATRRLADPIGAFIEDWCEVGEGQEITLDHLYLKYRAWCEEGGRTKDSTTKEIFSRDVRNKVKGLSSKRAREGDKFVTLLKGIGSTAL